MDNSEDLIESLGAAVVTTFREMADMEVFVRTTTRADGCDGFSDVSVSLCLSGANPVRLVLSLPARTAEAVTERVLKDVGGKLEDGMVLDCVSELINVIAGQTKTMLYGTPGHFTFSTPEVFAIGSIDFANRRWMIGFDSAAGAFSLYLCFPS